jgi:hypothetical protein
MPLPALRSHHRGPARFGGLDVWSGLMLVSALVIGCRGQCTNLECTDMGVVGYHCCAPDNAVVGSDELSLCCSNGGMQIGEGQAQCLASPH